MVGNNRRIIGKCSLCGGVVSVPSVIWMVGRVRPQCESCGAYADETANLPVIPMEPGSGPTRWEADCTWYKKAR